jgi:hypothetical protein
MERRGMHIGFWWESLKERDHQEDLYVGGMIILKWIGWYGLDSSGLGEGPVAGSCEHGNEP